MANDSWRSTAFGFKEKVNRSASRPKLGTGFRIKSTTTKTQEKEIKDELKELGELLKGSISERKLDKVKTAFGNFTLKKVNVWSYSKFVEDLEAQVDSLKEDVADVKTDIKELHSRITTVNREIHDRIDQVEHHISSRIDALRSDLANHKKQDIKDGGLKDKIADIEKWRWTMMGAIAVIAWLAGQADIIGKLLK